MSNNPPEDHGESYASEAESYSPLGVVHSIPFESNENLDIKVSPIESHRGCVDMDIEQGKGFVGNSENSIPKRTKVSGVWEDFKRSVENGLHYATCLHCGRKLSRGKTKQTSSMLRHRDRCVSRNTKLKKLNLDKFDTGKVKEGAAFWVLMHEHPFDILEGFNMMMSRGMEEWRGISPSAVEKECARVYEVEKKRLKAMLECAHRVSLAIDMWKSESQKIEFMVVYGCWIDSEWKLRRRALNFVYIPPPQSGVEISTAIVKCVKEWGIEQKIYTVSVANTLNNDDAAKLLKDDIGRIKALTCGGRLFHVRCYSHILNLMVQDCLSEINNVCEKIRDSADFVGRSSERTLLFTEIAQQLGIHEKKLLHDCWTRWDFTYEMLSCALKFKEVFLQYRDHEPLYEFCPSDEEWGRLENVCSILGNLWTSIHMLSSNDHVTSNMFLLEILKVKKALDALVNYNDNFIQEIAFKMKFKFDKYWDECSMLVSVAAMLDPRQKMKMVEFAFSKMCSPECSRENIAKVKETIFYLFEEYVGVNASVKAEVFTASEPSNQESHTSSSLGWADFDEYCAVVETREPEKSELQDYLDKPRLSIGSDPDQFDCLSWWKENQSSYLKLSQLARDILTIPMTTVAAEDMFSAGNMEIDSYWASLSPKTLQILVCAGDWCRASHGVKKEQARSLREYELPTI